MLLTDGPTTSTPSTGRASRIDSLLAHSTNAEVPSLRNLLISSVRRSSPTSMLSTESTKTTLPGTGRSSTKASGSLARSV